MAIYALCDITKGHFRAPVRAGSPQSGSQLYTVVNLHDIGARSAVGTLVCAS